jgi:predicted CopG family antitoxin
LDSVNDFSAVDGRMLSLGSLYSHAYIGNSLFLLVMAKTIAISDDVYQLLSRAKLPGESFSDVIRRGMKRPLKLSDTVGSKTISKEDWERARAVIRNAEAETRKKLRKTLS